MSHSHYRKSFPVEMNSLQEECIRVQKVYDWVTDALTVKQTIHFTSDQIKKIEQAMDTPSKRPLRLVCHTPKRGRLFGLSSDKDDYDSDVHCEQVGEKRNVKVPVNGKFADAQLVDLLFTSDIKVSVVDRHGDEVTSTRCNVSVFEPFVLCHPDGTELFCKVTKVLCKIPSGTVLLNSPCPSSFKLEVTFCVDIQVEAEVKLEVLAKFCSPRDNDLDVPENSQQCPDSSFPTQCPDIFPRQSCDCSARADASGMTSDEATEHGRIGISADICPNFSIKNSKLLVDFKDKDPSDGIDDTFFRATDFDQSTLTCEPCDGEGLMLKISGRGRTNKGKRLDFNLALVDSSEGDQFQLQLIDGRGKIAFDSGIVDVEKGKVKVEECVSLMV